MLSRFDYAMARYYINRYGRFSCVDPLLSQVGDPQTWNRYAYVRNNPTNNVDPSGMGFLGFLVKFLQVLLSILSGGQLGSFPGSGTAGTPPIVADDPLSNTQATLNSIYHPIDPGQFGIENFMSTASLADPNFDPDANSDLLDLLRKTILDQEDCWKLFSKTNPGIAKDILAKYKGVVDISGKPGENMSSEEQQGRKDLAATGAVVVSETRVGYIDPPDNKIKAWMGAPITTYAGSQFYKDYPDPMQKMTVLVHELLHVAYPNTPLTETETAEHNNMIRKKCKTK